MIPKNVADLADLIFPGWENLAGDKVDEALKAAWRIHRAGYRKQE